MAAASALHKRAFVRRRCRRHQESRKEASKTRLPISVSSTTAQLGSDTPLAYEAGPRLRASLDRRPEPRPRGGTTMPCRPSGADHHRYVARYVTSASTPGGEWVSKSTCESVTSSSKTPTPTRVCGGDRARRPAAGAGSSPVGIGVNLPDVAVLVTDDHGGTASYFPDDDVLAGDCHRSRYRLLDPAVRCSCDGASDESPHGEE